MNIATDLPEISQPVSMVEVLTHDTKDVTLGYRLGGFRAGPAMLVAGHDPVASIVYDRLLMLPTLAWMRGSLTLVFLNQMERKGLQAHLGTNAVPGPDALFFLPYHLDETRHNEAASDSYWSILEDCTRLGMISGRGLPYRHKVEGMHYAS